MYCFCPPTWRCKKWTKLVLTNCRGIIECTGKQQCLLICQLSIAYKYFIEDKVSNILQLRSEILFWENMFKRAIEIEGEMPW